jgi:hypothetical protein
MLLCVCLSLIYSSTTGASFYVLISHMDFFFEECLFRFSASFKTELFIFVVILVFELRASWFLGRHSNA